jgi:cellobiose dehydrogenase (acceptor)
VKSCHRSEGLGRVLSRTNLCEDADDPPSGYTSPAVITGNFTQTPIPSGTYVNETAFSYTFLCSNCLGENGLLLSDTSNVLGWALSTDALTTPAVASSTLTYHTAGFGAFGMTVADAKSAEYATWAAMAVASNTTDPVGGGNSTTPAAPVGNTTATISNSTYDYIVAGGGPAGIIVAERIAESGASVLLLEGGGASLASTGNTNTLPWNSSVTMYDVPGVDYYLSTVGTPAYCTDTADQAGCLLGGGTMVNAMMFVRPQEKDFDAKWPAGWKWADIAAAADRLYERNPGQTSGSADGIRYNNQAYDVISKFLVSNGWSHTDAIEKPNDKTDAFSYPPWSVTADGLRSGPVRTYLPLAQAKSNFKLELNTKVIRAVRTGSNITGVETETIDGARIIYNVNAGGRVILSAGSMSTPRILFNSGIGPKEQLDIVAAGTTDVTLPEEVDWINLPVGTEIKDHPIFTLKFTTKVTMPALATTQFTSPNETSIDLFAQGSGILAQSGQRLSFWTSVNTTSGNEVFIQGTCNGPANNTVQMKIYLTHGITSVGSLGITADGATELTSDPWMKTDDDIEAATIFMDRLLAMTRQPNSTLTFLSAGDVTGANVTGADLIKNFITGAHYVGTAKMGTKGDAGVVVDTDTKVYGTDNLFVVDASMHPDLPTGNTQAIVMVAAEAAAAKILALDFPSNNTTPTNTTIPIANSSALAQATGTGVVPLPNGTGVALPVSSAAASLAPSGTSIASPVSSDAGAPSPISSAAPNPTSTSVSLYGQCGGNNWNGPTRCATGTTCQKQNDYYYQCIAGEAAAATVPTPTPRKAKVVNALKWSRMAKKEARVPIVQGTVNGDESTWERASFLDSY